MTISTDEAPKTNNELIQNFDNVSPFNKCRNDTTMNNNNEIFVSVIQKRCIPFTPFTIKSHNQLVED